MPARQYQLDAVQAIRQACRDNVRSVVCLPTGAGKGYILGDLARSIHAKGKRMLVLAHVAELVEQNANQCRRDLPPVAPFERDPVGILSAGLKERSYTAQILSAGIQTACRCSTEIGSVDLIICDESHLIQPGSESGMYRKFLGEMLTINPKTWIIGLTATPYRLKGGPIYGEDPDLLFDSMCYHISVLKLIEQGYLCRLTSKAPAQAARRDFSELHIRAGEFVAEEVEAITCEDSYVRDGVADMLAKSKDRHSILIFCSSVAHAEKVVIEIQSQCECGHADPSDPTKKVKNTCVELITGETPQTIRASIIASFKSGSLRYLVNVSVLTTGFDAPNVDCVAIFRPTISPGLFYQMVGRGFRLHKDKRNTLVLDFGGNVERHGPVDLLDQVKIDKAKSKKKTQEPVKVCDNCLEYVPIRDRICPSCDYVFPPPVRTEPERESSDAPITSDQVQAYDELVQAVTYAEHQKNGTDGTEPNHFTMKVGYVLGDITTIYEWVCPQHKGYARQKFIDWWIDRSICPVPDTVEQALYLAERGALSMPISLTLKKIPGKKFADLVRANLPEVDQDWTLSAFSATAKKATQEEEWAEYSDSMRF